MQHRIGQENSYYIIIMLLGWSNFATKNAAFAPFQADSATLTAILASRTVHYPQQAEARRFGHSNRSIRVRGNIAVAEQSMQGRSRDPARSRRFGDAAVMTFE